MDDQELARLLAERAQRCDDSADRTNDTVYRAYCQGMAIAFRTAHDLVIGVTQ